MEGEHDEGQQHEDEEAFHARHLSIIAEMEAEMEGQIDEVEQDEKVASQGHEIIPAKAMPIQKPSAIEMKTKAKAIEMKAKAMERRMLSGAAASSWGYEKFRVTMDQRQAIADELEKAIAVESSDESDHDEVLVKDEIESDESEMKTEDYDAWLAQSVPFSHEHKLCHEGDQPVRVYNLYNVPNKQLVAELARRLGD